MAALLIMAAVALLAIIVFREIATPPECTPFISTAATLSLSEPSKSESVLPPPEVQDAEATVSFIGNCSPASLLGSDVHGTFNSFLEEADEIVNPFAAITETDSLTVASCNAVLAPEGSLPETDIPDESTWLLGSETNAMLYKSLGIDAVSLETTHSLDYAEEGRSATKLALTTGGTQPFDSASPYITEIDGISVCILSARFKEEQPSIAGLVRIAASMYDVVIVYGQADDSGNQPSEWRMTGAREMINAGAKAVIEYTDRVQQIVRYGGGYIAYSLGNFIDGSTPPTDKQVSMILSLTIKRDGKKDKISLSYNAIPCVSSNDGWLPEPLHDPADAEPTDSEPTETAEADKTADNIDQSKK